MGRLLLPCSSGRPFEIDVGKKGDIIHTRHNDMRIHGHKCTMMKNYGTKSGTFEEEDDKVK